MKRLAEKVIRCCRELAAFTEEPGRTTRTFLSEPMRDVHRVLGEWMRGLGMRVWVDGAGNLRGLYGDARAPRLLVGSHLDTVPNAGAFDGILGVAMAIALVELRPKIALEAIGFSEEEGVRFGVPFIGSRALVGTLDDAVLARQDRNGVTVAAAIRNFGLDAAEIPGARFAAESVRYLEVHIEQGPVLEALGLKMAAVDAIVGQSRLMVTFQSKANHAGTTPMGMRHDAVAAASEWILAVESHARAVGGMVATVGSVEVSPNAGNVIAGVVRASLDVRHASDAVRLGSVRALVEGASGLGERRGVAVGHEIRMDQGAVPLDAGLWPGSLHRMASGAGHDAMVIAPYLPTSMLFLRSPGGISHHPDEAVLAGDVEAALELLAELYV